MPTIKYTFTASGQEAVKQAFKSIDGAAAQSARVQQQVAKQAAKKQVTDQRGQARAQAQAARQQAAQQRAAQREQQKSLRDRVRLEKEAARIQARNVRAAATAQRKDTQERTRRDKRRRELGFGAAKAAIGSLTAAVAGLTVLYKRTEEERRGAINLGIKTSTADQRRDPREFLKHAQDVARKTPGTSTGDVLKMLSAGEGRAGNIDLLKDTAPFMARFQSAAGMAAEDVGSLFGELIHSWQIDSVSALSDAAAAIHVMGKRYQTEARDLAGILGVLSPMAVKAGLRGEEGMATTMALFQMARGETGDDAKAQKAVFGAFKELTGIGGARIEKAGVTLYQDKQKTKLRDPLEIFQDIIAKTKGSSQGIAGIMGETSAPLLEALAKSYREAVDETTGTEKEKVAAGKKAMALLVESYTDSTNARKEIDQDYIAATSDLTTQLRSIGEDLQTTLGNNFFEGLSDAGFKAEDFAELVRAAGVAARIFGEVLGGALSEVVSTLRNLGLLSEDYRGPTESSVKYELAQEKLRDAQADENRIKEKLKTFEGRELSKKEEGQKAKTERELERAQDRRIRAEEDLAPLDRAVKIEGKQFDDYVKFISQGTSDPHLIDKLARTFTRDQHEGFTQLNTHAEIARFNPFYKFDKDKILEAMGLLDKEVHLTPSSPREGVSLQGKEQAPAPEPEPVKTKEVNDALTGTAGSLNEFMRVALAAAAALSKIQANPLSLVF